MNLIHSGDVIDLKNNRNGFSLDSFTDIDLNFGVVKKPRPILKTKSKYNLIARVKDIQFCLF